MRLTFPRRGAATACALVGALAGLVLTFSSAADAAIIASPGTLCSTTLQEGSTGSCVVSLQQRLNQLGATLTVDGDFGPATKNAVLAFQGRSSISFDGVVGPTTQSHLNNPGTVNLNRVSATTINNYIDTVFGANATTARKIAVCESSDNEIALNHNTNGTYDIGVFQDNTVHEGSNPTLYIHNMLYYQTNIQEAHSLYVAAGGFSPWYSSKSCWG